MSHCRGRQRNTSRRFRLPEASATSASFMEAGARTGALQRHRSQTPGYTTVEAERGVSYWRVGGGGGGGRSTRSLFGYWSPQEVARSLLGPGFLRTPKVQRAANVYLVRPINQGYITGLPGLASAPSRSPYRHQARHSLLLVACC